MAFGQGLERIDHLAVQPAKIAGIGMHFDRVTCIHQPVKQLSAHALGTALTGPVGNHAIDHVVAMLPELTHLRQHLQRMLKIGINQQHHVAARMVNTC